MYPSNLRIAISQDFFSLLHQHHQYPLFYFLPKFEFSQKKKKKIEIQNFLKVGISESIRKMGSDAIANARVSAFNNHKSSNKKRGNKSSKFKPNKVDARTQHGTSQVNKKEHNVKKNKAGGANPPSIPIGREGNRTQGDNQATIARKNENEIVSPIAYENETLSWKSGSIVRTSDRDKLSKNFYGSRISSCSGSCSSSCSEDDGCLDDWEAVADALTAETNRQTSDTEQRDLKSEASGINCQYQRTSRAWTPDDVYRPRSLPSISKQQYNQVRSKPERCFSRGSSVFSRQSVVPQSKQKQPSACPICCEDFDVTDSSFDPCPCGFRVCLFCHKKILEVDGRCPGCRKHYDSVKTDSALPVQITYSWSKNTLVE